MAIEAQRVDKIPKVVLEYRVVNLTPDVFKVFRASRGGHAQLYSEFLKRGYMNLDSLEVSKDESSDLFGFTRNTYQGILSMGLHTDTVLYQRREESPQKACHVSM